MKKLEKMVCVVGVAMLVLLSINFVEIQAKKMQPNPDYSQWNVLARIGDNKRVAQGCYHDNGTIITSDGHIWGYESDTLANGSLVEVTFGENYTMLDLTDDIILDVAPMH